MIILLEKAANSIPNPDAGKATLFVDTSGNLQVKLDDGSLGNIQANAGSFTGAVNLGSIANLTITGGTSGQVLKTYGNGTVYFGVDSAAAGGSNTQIQYNDQGVANGSAAFVFNNTTNAITASGNLQAGNLSATLITGTLTTNAQPNVTSVGTLTGLTVAGDILPSANLTYDLGSPTQRFNDLYLSGSTIDLNSATISANATAVVITNPAGGSFTIGGTSAANASSLVNGNSNVIVIANGNVTTSVGGNANVFTVTDTGVNVAGTLNSSGNANVGNLGVARILATANITAPQIISNIATGTAPFIVTSTTKVANLNAETVDGYDTDTTATANTIVVRNADGNISGNYFIGNGSQLTGIDATSIQNGNSNVKVYANANVAISVAGNSNVVLFTGTGANIDGTLNATGNANVGNLGTAGLVVATGNVTGGNLTTAGALSVTGNANVGNIGAAAGVFTGTISVTGNANVGNLGTAGLVVATGNVSGGNITTSGVVAATGNVTGANLTTGGVVVATGNVSGGNLTTGGVVVATGNVSGGNLTTGGLVVATGNVTGGNLTTAGALSVTGNANVGNIGAAAGVFTTVAGSLTTAAQPNITSVGTLSSLAVTGTTTSGNIFANSGTVGASLLTGTLTTASQPNITSTGTLTSLSVTGNVSAGNVSGTLLTGTLATAAQPNVTSLGTLSSVTASGNIQTSANIVTDLIAGRTTSVTITAAGTNQNINLVPTGTGSVNVGTFRISNVATPTQTADAATKQYVDNLAASGIHYHDPVFVESPDTAGSLNATYNNGTSGVGATLTNAGTQAALTIDGVLMTVGKRVLIYNQTNQFENGIYTVTTVGNGSSNWVLTRATDADTYNPFSPNSLGQGDAFFVTNGDTGAGETYICNTVGTITFGTTAITFAQISDSTLYTAGTGLTLSGTQFSISNTAVTTGTYGGADVVSTIAVNQQGQITSASNTVIQANAANLSGTTLKSTVVNSSLTSVGTLTSLTVSGNASAGNLNTAGAVTASTLVSNVASGTAPFTITSTTRVANLNVAYANVADNINVTEPGTGTGYVVFANATTGNVAELTSAGISSNLANNSITATTFVGALSGAATTAGTVTTAAQPNITSLGTLSSLSVTGNVSTGNVSGTLLTGTLTTAAQPNVTSLGTLSSLGVSGNITAANITANTGVISGNGSSLTALNASNVSSGTLAQARLANSAVTLGSTALTLGSTVTTVAGLSSVTSTSFVGALTGAATTAGTVTTAAQPNITSVGTLSSVAVTGNATVGNLIAGGGAGGNITGANLVSANFFTGTLTTAAQPNITSVGTLGSLAVTGAITAGNVYANSGTGGFTTLQATTFTTGANTTAGTVTGNFALSTGSRFQATYA